METVVMCSRGKIITWCRMLVLAFTLLGLVNALPIGARSAAAEGSGTVYVHIHGCDAEDAELTDLDLLMQYCTEAPIYNNAYIISEGITTKGTPDDDNLDWTWDGVPAHNFGIKAHVDSYDAEPTVFCQNGKDDHAKLMESSMVNQYGYVHPTMTGGYVTCEWFAKTGQTDKTASVSIDAFECPVGTDGDNASLNDLYAACDKPQNGFTMIVQSPNNGASGLTTGNEKAGNVYWQYLKPEKVEISGEAILGYRAPRVFCDSGADQAGYQDLSTGGWALSHDFVDGEKLTCNWYNIPAAGATVQINNHLCPGGPYLKDADIYTLAQTCQMNMNGVSFELTSPSDSRTNITGDSAGSAVKWFDVAPTNSTIYESQFPGYYAPRVFCSSTVAENADPAETKEYPVTDGAINIVIQAGSYLLCDWFNLPDGGEAQTGSVMIYPVACPDGFDVGNSTLEESTDKCVTPQDLTDFQLVTQNSIFSLKSGWWESGVVIFYGVGSNQDLTLVATPRDGYQTGAVYCGQSLDSDGQTNGFDRMSTTDTNTIFPTVVPGAQEVCHWFMTPITAGQSQVNGDDADDQGDTGEDGDNGEPGYANENEDGTDELLWTGRVEITNRVCPVGFDPNSQDLWENCRDNANGFGFGIYSAGQWWPQTTGDWADQMVIWDPVPVQDVIILGSIPGGFTTPIVYCDGYQMEVAGDGSINLTVNDGRVIACTWFNVQE